MSHIPWHYLAPDLTWDKHSANGRWLEHFIFFLAYLRSKRDSNMQQELAAFLALLDAAEHFIDDDYDAYDPDSELKPQLIQIAQADEWGRTSQFNTLT